MVETLIYLRGLWDLTSLGNTDFLQVVDDFKMEYLMLSLRVL